MSAVDRDQQSHYRAIAKLWWLILLLGLCLLILRAHPAAAQSPTLPATEPGAEFSIKRLRVQVMPEFDDPRVLVVVQGRLDVPSEDFPQPVTFRVPRGAQINQMATMDMATGATTPRSYDAQPDPNDSRWSLVTYTLDNAHFFFEYYYDPLVGETDKQFTFSYSSPQAIEDLALEVQQPLAATNFAMDPPATVARADDKAGFTYHQLNGGSLEAGGEMVVKVSYTKTDPEPSLTRDEVMVMMGETPPEMATPAEPSRASGSSTWILLLGGMLLVAAGGFIWYRRRPDTTSMAARDLESARDSMAPEAPESPAEFCTQCGAALKADARFCHVCGAKGEKL